MFSLSPTLGNGFMCYRRQRKAGADDTALAGSPISSKGHVVLGSIILHQQLSQRCGTHVVYWSIVGDLEYVFALCAFHLNIDQRAAGPRLSDVEGTLTDLIKRFRQD